MKITESQLRRIIRQEVRQLTEASGFRFPADYPKEWRASRRNFPGDWEIAAEQAVGAGVPMQFTPAYKEMTRTTRGFQAYHKKIDAHLLRVQRAASAKAGPAPEPEPLVSRGVAPKVRGGSPDDRAIAQDALDMLYAGEDALESVVPYIVEQTLTYGDDEYHDAESSRPRPEGDRADVIVGLIRRVDPAAADELEDALDGYVH